MLNRIIKKYKTIVTICIHYLFTESILPSVGSGGCWCKRNDGLQQELFPKAAM